MVALGNKENEHDLQQDKTHFEKVNLVSDEMSLNMDCLLLLSLQSFLRPFCPTLQKLTLRELDLIGNCHL